MTRCRKFDLYRATNHSTGAIQEYIAAPEWAYEFGFDLVDDPEGYDTDIEMLEKGGWIYVFGETLSGWHIGDYIRLTDLTEFKKGMATLHIALEVK